MRARRTERLLATRQVREAIVSLAGLMGRPVVNQGGAEIGRLHDIVVRWSDDELYPPVTGLVVRVGRRLAFVDAGAIERFTHGDVCLRSSRLDLRDYQRRPGEVLIAKDLLDHQLVDVDGVQVVRASDLYLANVRGRLRLVGVDVSVNSLVRRLGPARWRTRPTPGRVIDWAAIQPFGDGTNLVRLRTSHEGLHRLRPGELADLLEDLGRPARQELLAHLDPEQAADALEEMDPEELEALLREAPPEQAAELVASMEPDEAVDALRDLGEAEREELLANMPADVADQLTELLDYPADSAGGIMTTIVVTAGLDENVDSVCQRLRDVREHRGDLDAVAVVDPEGRFLGDLPLYDLAVADRLTPVAELLVDTTPVTVKPDAPLRDVAAHLVEARQLSIVVVDDEGRPQGRILADDMVDALLPERGRLHFPRLLQ
ncbi:MAG TPA: CBS domain-containing protein [Acidimicrobiales bacterium]|nr:CBS domain-containing protein [Acidimicrobiales bacterium]